jgi:DNA-directed RNA polymerase subunit H (RpoH/RPB5)
MSDLSSTQVTTMTYEDICENCNRSLGHELCMSNRWHESSSKVTTSTMLQGWSSWTRTGSSYHHDFYIVRKRTSNIVEGVAGLTARNQGYQGCSVVRTHSTTMDTSRLWRLNAKRTQLPWILRCNIVWKQNALNYRGYFDVMLFERKTHSTTMDTSMLYCLNAKRTQLPWILRCYVVWTQNALNYRGYFDVILFERKTHSTTLDTSMLYCLNAKRTQLPWILRCYIVWTHYRFTL